MRRADREVTDQKKIAEVIERCHCCRLGFCDKGEVYILPLNFGYEEGVFYFHGAREGRKIDLIADSPMVGFELDTDYELHEAETACKHSARFSSVIGTGRVSFVEDAAEKEAALRSIMRHSTGKDEWTFTEDSLNSVRVFRLDVGKHSCKEHL